MIFALDEGKCCCGEKATTIVIMLLSVETKVEYDKMATWTGMDVCVQRRFRLLANTELIYACDNCQQRWDGFSVLKCRLGNEIPKQLIEIVQQKQRLISL